MKRYLWLVGLAIAVVPELCFGRTEYAPKIWVMKTDSLGDTLWTKYYEGRLPFMFGANCVQQTSDGGLIITGGIIEGFRSPCRLYLLKLDSNYDSAWSRVYEREDGEFGQYIKEVRVKGKQVDTLTFPLTRNLFGQAVVETPDKGFLIVAQRYTDSSSYTMPEEVNISDGIQLTKTDSMGNILWKKRHDFVKEYPFFYLQQLSDGGYIMTIISSQLIRFDSLGDTLWTRSFQGFSPGDIQEISDGGFLIEAWKDLKFLLIRTDSAGNIMKEYIYTGGEEFSRDEEFIVTVAGETDTVTVLDSTLTRYTIVIDSPGSSLAVKITGEEIGLDRLVLYEADGTTGGYFSKDSDEEPDEVKKLPIAFSLESVIPTPFTDNARVCFAMPVAQPVSLKVYDVAGREVYTLVNGLVDAGVHTLYWNGEDNQSRSVSSGVYFVRMATAGFEATRKTVLLR